MKTSLNQFTSKMYIVTYEKATGRESAEYGIMSVHNKPQSAHSALKKLVKEQEKKDNAWTQYKFNLKTVDINSPFRTQLFEYLY